jgi:GTP-binding protein
MLITSATFVKSASKLAECPEADYPEFAFVGRSNVGKSSLINMLSQRKLAKVSDTPGKTQLLNYFIINNERYLVDLPGYGYAKYGKENRMQWMDTMQEFLTERPTLKTVFLLIDGSIPPQKIDMEFLQVLAEAKIAFEVIITKIDKCTQKELHKHLTALQRNMETILGRLPSIFQTSNTKGKGRDEVLSYIEQVIA